jgi:peptidoglycan/LPS O-acetylase OafA/YrhL
MASRPPLPNLTTVRLLAAVHVFCFHFLQWVPGSSMGFTGVNLFFVLSGFILAYNHPTVPDKRRFLAFRLARIYPLYCLSLLLGLPQFLSAHRHSPTTLLGIPLSFVLLQTWVPPLRNSLNYAAWTLPVEMFFYASFPLLLPTVARNLGRWKLWIAVLGMLLVLPTSTMFFAVMPAFPAHAATLKDLLNIPLFHLGEFVIGMFLGLRFLERQPTFSGRQVLLATLLLVVCLALARPIPWRYLELMLDGLFAVPYGIFLYVLAGWRSRWFAHPLLQLGGEISYGLYLLQFQFELVLVRFWHPYTPAVGLTLLVITSLAAYACYVWVEKPARQGMLRRFGYHPTPKPIPTPGLTV